MRYAVLGMMILAGAAVMAAPDAPAGDKVKLSITLPPPVKKGTPKEIKSPNLEPDPGVGKLRAPIMVKDGFAKLLSKDKECISSVEPTIGDLEYLTDGDKECDETAMVQLEGGKPQWVQVDLGAEHEISACCVWHDQGDDRVYHDVICMISNDKDMKDAKVVFNNDHDNSAGFGVGKDMEYRERNEGRPFPVDYVKGRYVRFYSNGSSSEPVNNYFELEVYGK